MTPFTRWIEAAKFFEKVHGDCSILIELLGGVGIYQHTYVEGKPITRGSLLWPYKPCTVGPQQQA